MIVGILGLVLWTNMFPTILTGLVTLANLDYIANYTAFETVLKISASVIYLGGIFGMAWIQKFGYQQASSAGVNMLIATVLGVLEIILFVTLFATVMTGIEAVRTADNVSYFIALSTVVQLSPAILFLLGLFSGGAMAVSGYKSSKKDKAGALA
jgi:hypothetical protein